MNGDKMNLRQRLLKNSNLATMLEDSDIFKGTDFVPTNIPILDIALSGEIGKGLTRGLTIFAGPSKHFKSLMGLILVRRYMEENPDATCMFYDSEFGTTEEYFKGTGIDTSRVIHVGVATLEELRGEVANTLETVEKGEKLIIFVDSIGNLASQKEIKDALEGSEKADMTRAKVVKSITRICSGYLNTKNIPMIMIGHTYDSLEMYSKMKLSGGTGIYYNAMNIIFMGRQQNKKDKELLGYDFIMNIEKSRFVKEGTKLPFKVTYDRGVHTYSGLQEIALEGGFIKVGKTEKGAQKAGSFTRPCVPDDKSFHGKNYVDIEKDFWTPVFENTDFLSYVKDKFQLKTALFKEEKNDSEKENTV